MESMQEWYFELLATELGSRIFSGDKYVSEPNEYWFDNRYQVLPLMPEIGSPTLRSLYLLFLIDIIDEAISRGFLHSHNLSIIAPVIEVITKQANVILDKLFYL